MLSPASNNQLAILIRFWSLLLWTQIIARHPRLLTIRERHILGVDKLLYRARMTFRSFVVLAVALAPSAAFSQDLAPEVLMLARIKAHMRHEIVQIPNFTCVENLERYHKDAGSKSTMRPLDTLQLEVAHIGGRELFSWLGDRNFKEEDPAKFVGGGMIGNGVFVAHVRSVFVDDNGVFQYRGQVDLNGRRSACYSFQISLRMSAFEITLNGATGTVGTKGMFWVDPQSLDLIRLEIHADEIPPTLPLVDAITTIDYARMRIGTADVLMPQTGDMRLIEFSGEENRDVIEFTHCRSFNTESSISFTGVDSPPAVASSAEHAPTQPGVQETVPGGLLVSLVLNTPLTDQAAVGQVIEAKVSGNVQYKGQILIPDGSVVRGRVRRLERNSEPESYFIVALEFNEIQAGASLLPFYADLQNIQRAPGVESFLSYSNSTRTPSTPVRSSVKVTNEQIRLLDLPGVGSFFVRGAQFSLPKGLVMTWKTRALSR